MMKLNLILILKSLLHWLRGGDTQALESSKDLVTLPSIGTISRFRLHTYFVIARNVFILMLIVQGIRCGTAIVRSHSLLSAMNIEQQEVSREKMRESIDAYKIITEKGILGAAPKKQAQQLFGILGSQALFGTSADNAKPFGLEAEIPGGEKIIAINGSSVEVEKDGKKRTVSVFPDKPKK